MVLRTTRGSCAPSALTEERWAGPQASTELPREPSRADTEDRWTRISCARAPGALVRWHGEGEAVRQQPPGSWPFGSSRLAVPTAMLNVESRTARPDNTDAERPRANRATGSGPRLLGHCYPDDVKKASPKVSDWADDGRRMRLRLRVSLGRCEKASGATSGRETTSARSGQQSFGTRLSQGAAVIHPQVTRDGAA